MSKSMLQKNVIGILVSAALLGACGNTLLDEIRAVSAARTHQAEPQMLIVSGGATIDDGETVHIGSTAEGAKIERRFDVRNDGDAHLEFTSVFHDNDLGLFSLSTPPPSRVAPGSVISIVVAFTPASLGDVSAVFAIESNAANLQSWSVEITGSGVAAGSVISPEPGELILPGQIYSIEWAPFPEGNVAIALYSSGVLHETIASNISDSGSHLWTTPSGADGSNYRVRITSVLNEAVWEQSGQFSIGTITEAYISGVSPAYVEPGQEIDVHWSTGLSSSEKVDVKLFRGGVAQATLAAGASNSENRRVTIPASGHTGTGYSIRVVAEKNHQIFSDTNPFAIGTIAVTAPTAGTQWTRNQDHYILWSDGQLEGTVRIEYRRGSGSYVEIVDEAPNNGSYRWSIPPDVEPSDNFRIRVTFLAASFINSESEVFAIHGGTLGAPTFSPPGGYFVLSPTHEEVTVTLSAPSVGAQICYTTNGDTPTTSHCAPSYQAEVTVSARTTVIKAFSRQDFWTSSSIVEHSYHHPVRLVGTIGTAQAADATDRFNNPRGILYHNNEIYVADWGNRKIKVYRADNLIYQRQWSTSSDERPYAIALAAGDLLVSVQPVGAGGSHGVRLYSTSGAHLNYSAWGFHNVGGILYTTVLSPSRLLATDQAFGVRHFTAGSSGWVWGGDTFQGLETAVDIAYHVVETGNPMMPVTNRYFYVLDRSRQVIRRYGSDFAFQLEFGDDSNPFSNATGLFAANGTGLFIYGLDGPFIYLTNTGRGQVQVYSRNGPLSYLFGGLDNPQHVTRNGCDIFVTDRHRVQKFRTNSSYCNN